MPTAPKRFVLFPLAYDALWVMYKDAETRIWFVEDILDRKLTEDDVEKASAVALFQAVVVINEFASAKLISSVCPAPEAACFLGFQVFLEGIYFEAAARVLEDGFPGAASGEQDAGSPPSLVARSNLSAAHKLLTYYTFWAAWEDGFVLWCAQASHVGCAQWRNLVTKISEGGADFTKFGAEACCTFLDAEDITSQSNVDFAKRTYVHVAECLEAVLDVAWDKNAGADEALRRLVSDVGHPRFVSLRAKRAVSDQFTTNAEF